ncbi:hypothetical protein [Bradyrhizobium sp. dw_411]|uniref:hypothetical protein n=1 Tax=Bradyrhizobium sp. dw_411 TaxID=2720082 RepID=UPI001BCEFBBE|nr:hypothetical protein [Bradyrhizobium sp. dw_411]
MQDDVFVEGLARAEEVRIALTDRFEWFTHDTGFSHLTQVRDSGLPTREYEPWEIPVDVKEARGGEANCRILCFHPLGAKLRPPSSKERPHIRLAVAGADLPKLVGLDWTYEQKLVRSRRRARASAPIEDVSVEIANELGSVSVYEPIKPELLRVWTIGASDDPAAWPWLNDTKNDEIMKF